MLDENLAMDRAKLVYIARLPHGEALLSDALSNTEGVTTQHRAETVNLQAGLAPICDFIEQRYFKILSNRDYRWSNELLLKTALLTLLFNDRLYMMVSELETERGYVDLALIVRPEMRRVRALDLLLELKYLGLKALGLSGEQVRAHSKVSISLWTRFRVKDPAAFPPYRACVSRLTASVPQRASRARSAAWKVPPSPSAASRAGASQATVPSRA